MEVFVALPTGKIISWEDDTSSTIKHVKEKIEVKEGIPSHQQLLIINTGQRYEGLADDCKLSDCSFLSNSTQLRLISLSTVVLNSRDRQRNLWLP